MHAKAAERGTERTSNSADSVVNGGSMSRDFRKTITLIVIVVPLGLALAAGDPVLEGFNRRLEEYVKIRKEAAAKVPAIGDKATAEKIQEHENALAEAIRAARPDAKPGDILTPDVKPLFARILENKTSGKQGKKVLATIKEGNPKHEKAPGEIEPVLKVNAAYPKNAPLSSVPPTLLLRLPKLPKDIEYRFVGRTLLLRDRQANIIIDYMKEAVPLP